MFEKVLVANRGEIAVRVMAACAELGVETVAVYSDADADAGHVRHADEAYRIGPARAADSYLDQGAVLDAAREAGADAIHPGYGFLAENAEFAERVEAADGITWVGPPASAMAAMGEKTSARQVMREADVPIVPGTTDPIDGPQDVRAFAKDHGYPVAIKAEGGGGGRGMKIVHDEDEIADQLERARREGQAYFDNDAVYLERYLESPRHIEIQILADAHGNVLHLGERDCSLQRHHQKVIEEGPSPALSEALRPRIGEAATRGAEAAGYVNAGTVEFLVDDADRAAGEVLGPDADVYFLEMNTRIQVEHTVTEELTGVDIVAWQLRIAAGEPLPITQDDVELTGHAVQFRINAEDAMQDFAPASGGELSVYDPPGFLGIRVDDAVRQGDAIGGDYDSMIAKLIVAGSDREQCLARSKRALESYAVEGVTTIIPLHLAMLHDEAFRAGTYTTKYLDEYADRSEWGPFHEAYGSGTTAVEPTDASVAGEYTIEAEGRQYRVTLQDQGPAEDDASTPLDQAGDERADEASTASDAEAAPTDGAVTADMQGTILKIDVETGDEIAAGDVLCVLEAMKMENEVVAPSGGTVASVEVTEGDSVNEGDRLFRIK